VLPSAAQDELLHVVIQIEGEAYLSHFSQPSNYSDENLLTVGSFVKSSDIIEVGAGSSVVILCANRSTDTISNDTRSPNCGTANEALVVFNNVEVYGQQRAAADDIVYVTSPRNTMMLTATPDITWTPIPNDASRGITYKVTLYNQADNSIVWERTGITGNSLAYPEDEQPLPAVDEAERPIRYQFVVTPVLNGEDMRNFDPLRPEGFCIVSARNRPLIERAITELNSVSLSDPISKAFYTAVYYHGRRLYSEAQAELLSILPVPLSQPFPADQINAESITGSPSYYLLLANVMYAQRLPLDDVKAAYERAGELATALGDTVALATVNEQLGDILRGRKPKIDQSRDADIFGYYDSAEAAYAALNDQTSVDRINVKVTNEPNLATGDLCG
jgi:hypothetical protein